MIAGNAIRALHSYWLYVPPNYDGSKPVPLVICLSGYKEFSFKDPLVYFSINVCEKFWNFSQKIDDLGLFATGFTNVMV
jgi:hypothetical protein